MPANNQIHISIVVKKIFCYLTVQKRRTGNCTGTDWIYVEVLTLAGQLQFAQQYVKRKRYK